MASSYQAQPRIAFPFEAGRRATVSKPIPNAYSEAHFLPMLPNATRRDDVAGNKQVYGGNAPCEVQRSKVLADHMQALPAVRPRSFRYMVILINFTV